uniref:Uncharacterized protein n=1 Tax=Avena sativa TaxID=4498 RepID=A0ACD5WUN0_AVESA
MALARVSSSSSRLLLLPSSTTSSLLHSFLRPFSTSHFSAPRLSHSRSFPVDASFPQTSPLPSTAREEGEVTEEAPRPTSRRPWKPTCLYYTQGKCTMMDDVSHLEKFNHSLLLDLPVNASAADKAKPQKLDYFLVLDLEGKVEILEFPVVMIDAHSMEFIDSFHRFVRPTGMSEQRIGEYIEGKYGKFGVDRVWHDTAIPFGEVLREFEDWIGGHKLWKQKQGESLNSAAFITW